MSKKVLKTIYSEKSWLFLNCLRYFFISIPFLILIKICYIAKWNFRNIYFFPKSFLTLKEFSFYLLHFIFVFCFFVWTRKKCFRKLQSQTDQKVPIFLASIQPYNMNPKDFLQSSFKKIKERKKISKNVLFFVFQALSEYKDWFRVKYWKIELLNTSFQKV